MLADFFPAYNDPAPKIIKVQPSASVTHSAIPADKVARLMLRGECEELRVRNCLCPSVHPHGADEATSLWIRGMLIITNHRVVVLSESDDHRVLFDLPLTSLRKVVRHKRGNPNCSYSLCLSLQFVQCCEIKIAFQPEDCSREKVFSHLSAAVAKQTTQDITNFFCFVHGAEKREERRHASQMFQYCPQKEFARQKALENGWRITDINKGHKFIPSYPEALCVPAALSDDDVRDSARSREYLRFPTLSYYHASSHASLTRSAQATGVDVQYVHGIARASKMHTNDKNDLGHFEILDLRPYHYAIANKARGAGPESATTYGVPVLFGGIERLVGVQESFVQLTKLIARTGEMNAKESREHKWLSELERTQWLQLVSCLLDVASDCARKLDEGTGLLVHCTHGWDRTSQIVCLVQIILDPFCRTFLGLATLIEKEWVQAGHNFRTRSGFSKKDERAPIFLQFLDCLHQLLVQNPQGFEFNQNLLLFLADCQYSCLYGNFIADSPTERTQHNIPNATVSVWSYVFLPENMDAFRNESYHGNKPSAANTSATLDSVGRSSLTTLPRQYSGPQSIPRLIANGTPRCEVVNASLCSAISLDTYCGEYPERGGGDVHVGKERGWVAVDSRPHSLRLWAEFFLRFSGGRAVPERGAAPKWELTAKKLKRQVRLLQEELRRLRPEELHALKDDHDHTIGSDSDDEVHDDDFHAFDAFMNGH